jgi:hypothetical protein
MSNKIEPSEVVQSLIGVWANSFSKSGRGPYEAARLSNELKEVCQYISCFDDLILILKISEASKFRCFEAEGLATAAAESLEEIQEIASYISGKYACKESKENLDILMNKAVFKMGNVLDIRETMASFGYRILA